MQPAGRLLPARAAHAALGRPWVFDHHDLSPEVYRRAAGSPVRCWTRCCCASRSVAARRVGGRVDQRVLPGACAISRGGCDPTGSSWSATGRRPPRSSRSPPRPTETTATPSSTWASSAPQDGVDNASSPPSELIELRGRLGWRLVVAGDGECLASLQGADRRARARGRREFTGWLGVEEVDAAAAHRFGRIAAGPAARMTEVSTMAKTVEYLARGLPVVGRRPAGDPAQRRGRRRLRRHGTPEEFAGALHRLLDDPVARASMRNVALARFRNTLAWEHQAAAYVRLWDELLSTRRERYKAGSAIIRQAAPTDVSQAEQRQ